MTRQRLTRAEKSAQTRAQLMASARQLFLRRGFHAASLELVAEEAGFTIGAVYSRFGSKADLFLAILDEHIDRIVAEVAKVADLDQPLGAHAELLAGRRMDLLERERDWFPLVLEFWSHAARDERLRREFGARHERLVAAYAGLIEADYARLGLPLPMAPEVVAMGNGVALERLADPGRVPEGLLSTMAVAFLRGAAADGPATQRRS
jgi:AcrR family transcriptional regulator